MSLKVWQHYARVRDQRPPPPSRLSSSSLVLPSSPSFSNDCRFTEWMTRASALMLCLVYQIKAVFHYLAAFTHRSKTKYNYSTRTSIFWRPCKPLSAAAQFPRIMIIDVVVERWWWDGSDGAKIDLNCRSGGRSIHRSSQMENLHYWLII